MDRRQHVDVVDILPRRDLDRHSRPGRGRHRRQREHRADGERSDQRHGARCAISCSSPCDQLPTGRRRPALQTACSESLTTPSAPPSNTCTWPSCQFERRISFTTPGSTASAVVSTEQVEPTVLAGHVQGTVTPKGVSWTDADLGGAVVAVGDPQVGLDPHLARVVGRRGGRPAGPSPGLRARR